MENIKFLHCIDLNDKLKCLNLCSTRTISSLLVVQLMINDETPNPISIEIEQLRNYKIQDISGIASPRMKYIYQRSLLLQKDTLNQFEKSIVKIGELEIEFERARREYNSIAPSRLSSLYLVEDNFEGRISLNNMFAKTFKEPIILEVHLLNKFEIMKFDHNWIDQYFNEPNEEYLQKYWQSVMFDESKPSWEYLLEGTISLTNFIQIEQIDDYVKTHYVTEYKEIQKNKT